MVRPSLIFASFPALWPQATRVLTSALLLNQNAIPANYWSCPFSSRFCYRDRLRRFEAFPPCSYRPSPGVQ